jgi:galactoside O-acetyltransferase
MMDSFYSTEELRSLGLGKVGKNVKISRKCCIYSAGEIRMGDNVRIDDFCILSGVIELGSSIHVAAYVALYGRNGIRIEDFASLSARVTVYSAMDDFSGEHMTNPTVPEKYTRVTGGPVAIGKHVLVGAGTVVFPGVTLEEGCAIGALSLVNHSLEGWKVYAGIPCIYVKDRRKDLLKLAEKHIKTEGD